MSVPATVAERIRGEPLSAFLATAVDDRPHVAPVWYLFDEEAESVWFFTDGRKLENVEANPRVALAIEEQGTDGWVVLLRGTATVVTDGERRDEVADRLFVQYLGDPDADTFRTAGGEPTGELVRVDVGSVTLREQ